jgi:hypothetical protein
MTLFERIASHSHRMMNKYAFTVVGASTFIGSLAFATRFNDDRPTFAGTAAMAGFGAVAGFTGSTFIVFTYPVSLPLIGFVYPIYKYNEYRWEKARSNLK